MQASPARDGTGPSLFRKGRECRRKCPCSLMRRRNVKPMPNGGERGCGVWRSAAMRSAMPETDRAIPQRLRAGAAPRRAPISMVMAARERSSSGSPSAASFRDSKATMSCARSPGWARRSTVVASNPAGFVSGSSLPCHRHRCFQRRRSCAHPLRETAIRRHQRSGSLGCLERPPQNRGNGECLEPLVRPPPEFDIGQEHPAGLIRHPLA